jgi:hypothetical protein
MGCLERTAVFLAAWRRSVKRAVQLAAIGLDEMPQKIERQAKA